MSDADLTQSPAHFSLWREVQDTRTRTRLGGIYYLLARLLAEQFREDLANRGFQLGEQHLPITASLGLRPSLIASR